MTADTASPRSALLPVSAVAFDLDGTMLDTAGDIAGAVDATLVALGLAPFGEGVVRGFIGRGVVQLLKSVWLAATGAEPTEAQLLEGQTIFGDEYARGLTRTTRFYPGALEGINALQAAGFPLACITNKPARFTIPLLQAVGLGETFELVLSGDTLPVKKPDPGQLIHAARQLNVEPAELLLVGDSMHDLQAARAAQCPVFCVRYGYTEDPMALVRLSDRGLDSLDEILPHIALKTRRAPFASTSGPGTNSGSAPSLQDI